MITNHNNGVREANESTGLATAAAVSTAEEVFLGIDTASVRHVVARFVFGEGVKPAEGMTTATLLARVARWRKAGARVHCVYEAGPPADPPPAEGADEFAELVRARQDLVGLITAELGRCEHLRLPALVKLSHARQKQLAKQLATLDALREAQVAAQATLVAKAERLQQVAGVGRVSALTVLALLPELGQITATAHKLARIIYHLLKIGAAFDDTVFARNEIRYHQRRAANLRQQARALGFTLVPRPAAGEVS